jgi:hypothetical protein
MRKLKPIYTDEGQRQRRERRQKAKAPKPHPNDSFPIQYETFYPRLPTDKEQK